MRHRLRPWPRLLIGNQRHRCDFSRPVATLAAILQDWQHIFIKRRRPGDSCHPESSATKDCQPDREQSSDTTEPHNQILQAQVFPLCPPCPLWLKFA
jgi:hypothetical protein